MRTFAAAACLALLAGCAMPTGSNQVTRTELWRAPGQQRTQANLDSDQARCKYQTATALMARQARPPAPFVGGGPGFAALNANVAQAMQAPDPEGLYRLCMAGEGWQFAGWE